MSVVKSSSGYTSSSTYGRPPQLLRRPSARSGRPRPLRSTHSCWAVFSRSPLQAVQVWTMNLSRGRGGAPVEVEAYCRGPGFPDNWKIIENLYTTRGARDLLQSGPMALNKNLKKPFMHLNALASPTPHPYLIPLPLERSYLHRLAMELSRFALWPLRRLLLTDSRAKRSN